MAWISWFMIPSNKVFASTFPGLFACLHMLNVGFTVKRNTMCLLMMCCVGSIGIWHISLCQDEHFI